MTEVRVQTDPTLTNVTGRNGNSKVKEVVFFSPIWCEEEVMIRFINTKGMCVNGGATMVSEDLDRLCLKWLSERGKLHDKETQTTIQC